MKTRSKLGFGQVFGALVVLVGGYYLLFGPQTIIVLSLRRNLRASESSLMEATPKALPSDEESDNPGTALSYFGYQFEAPWVGIEKEEIGTNVAVVYFRSGPFVLFENPAKTVQSLKELTQGDQRIISALGDAAKSNYALYDSVLRMTPHQLSVFMPRPEAVRAGGLLPLKLVFAHNSESGLYAFTRANMRGFQCGSPGQSKNVVVHAFDAKDQMLEFVFGTKDGSQASLVQAEINRVVHTLRPSL